MAYIKNSKYVKRDRNEAAIIAEFHRWSAQAHQISGAPGVPDLLCCAKCGKIFLVEVKQRGAKLTEKQKAWHNSFYGVVYCISAPKEVSGVIAEVQANNEQF